MELQIKYPEEWLYVKESEAIYLAAKHYFRRSDDFFKILTLALNHLSEQGVALRFIIGERFNDSELEVLIPKVIEIAIDGNIDNCVSARSFLIENLHHEIVKDKLMFVFDDLIQSHDEFVYRRIAELLVFINYPDLRVRLMSECKHSKDENLLEIYHDFIHQYS